MSDLKAFLEELTRKINEKALDLVREWIGDKYYGKIIEFEVGDLKGVQKAYHIVFTKKGARFKEGEYPSPDLIYRSDEETLKGILTGAIPEKEVRKTWKLIIMGDAHEMDPFAQIVATALK
ncbi:MAG: SCP2 sterol-binding domain-containing protein [Candidatus Jordarchaeales archaeon]